MARPVADMTKCTKKKKCLSGPNKGAAYDPLQPCPPTIEFNEEKCDCELLGYGLIVYQGPTGISPNCCFDTWAGGCDRRQASQSVFYEWFLDDPSFKYSPSSRFTDFSISAFVGYIINDGECGASFSSNPIIGEPIKGRGCWTVSSGFGTVFYKNARNTDSFIGYVGSTRDPEGRPGQYNACDDPLMQPNDSACSDGVYYGCHSENNPTFRFEWTAVLYPMDQKEWEFVGGRSSSDNTESMYKLSKEIRAQEGEGWDIWTTSPVGCKSMTEEEKANLVYTVCPEEPFFVP